MSDIYTWDEVLQSGELEGYEPHNNRVDAEVVSELRCENCDGEQIYHGYEKINSYRAFAECKNCGNVVEF